MGREKGPRWQKSVVGQKPWLLLSSALAPHTLEEVLIKVRLLGLNSYQFFTVVPAPDLEEGRCAALS